MNAHTKFTVLLLLMFSTGCAFAESNSHAQDKTAINIHELDLDKLNTAFTEQLNIRRKKARRTEQRHAAKLSTIAQEYALTMRNLDFFGHISPVEGLETFNKRLAAHGLLNVKAAENLAINFAIRYQGGVPFYKLEGTGQVSYQSNGPPIPLHSYSSFAQAVVQQWMKSRPHRKNILRRSYTRVGTGISFYREGELDRAKVVLVLSAEF